MGLIDQIEFNLLSTCDKWREYRDASEQLAALTAERDKAIADDKRHVEYYERHKTDYSAMADRLQIHLNTMTAERDAARAEAKDAKRGICTTVCKWRDDEANRQRDARIAIQAELGVAKDAFSAKSAALKTYIAENAALRDECDKFGRDMTHIVDGLRAERDAAREELVSFRAYSKRVLAESFDYFNSRAEVTAERDSLRALVAKAEAWLETNDKVCAHGDIESYAADRGARESFRAALAAASRGQGT